MTVKDIIMKHTVSHSGEELYPTLDKLIFMTNELRTLGKTAEEYVMITPFYENVNAEAAHWGEFSEYEFYIEFRRGVTDESRNEFIEECLKDRDYDRPDKLFFLCEQGDCAGFIDSLNTYFNYLIDEVLIKIHSEAERRISDKTALPFGYVGFEVLCD